MNTPTSPTRTTSAYELRFGSLFDEGRGYAFPCDAAGHVALDARASGLGTTTCMRGR